MLRLILKIGVACALVCASTAHSAEPQKYPTIKADEVESLTIKQLEARMAKGDLKAQAELGARYARGADVDVDLVKAIKLIEAAAIKEEPNAQYYLGTAYQAGAGVPQDLSRAAIWFEKAAVLNHAGAQFQLALLIAEGKGGFSADEHASIPYVEKSANQGYVPAEFRMGLIFQQALGIARDPEKAAYWYRRILSRAFFDGAARNLMILLDEKAVQWQPGDPGQPPATSK